MDGIKNMQNQEVGIATENVAKSADDNTKEMKYLCHMESELSLKNYSSWRDYLHKYYLVMLAIAGGFGIYEKDANQLSLVLIVTGVLIGFIVINLYLYWERKHIRFSYNIDIMKPYNWFNHPKIEESNPPLAMRFHLKDIIRDNKINLKKTADKIERKLLKGRIKADKRWLNNLKYWNMYGFEPVWLTGVIISLSLTFIGALLVFIKIDECCLFKLLKGLFA